MMATSAAPLWKTLRVCPADPLALSHPQANLSQSQECRGEVPEESQHLIGDGLTDWMTEEVDFSSYLPNPHPSPSPNSSLPPSPLQHDIQVPSDLEVMTSLLQEELAQLEDYFLSEPLPEKGPKLGKCDKGPPPVGPHQSYYQLPFHASSYSTSNQSEHSPLLVTLATGELDLLSFCGGGPIGRSKLPRHTPYSCSNRPNGCSRKRVSDGVRVGEVYENSIWSSKGSNPSVTLSGSYSCVEDERVVGKGYCLGSGVEIRRCPFLPKEEKNCQFAEEVIAVGSGYGGFGGPLDIPHKKEELLMYGMREVNVSCGGGGCASSSEIELLSSNVKVGVVGELSSKMSTIPWKTETSEGCYLQAASQSEASYHHGFQGTVSEQVKAEGLEMGRQHHDFHCGGFLEDQQGSECLAMDREALDRQVVLGLKEDPCPLAKPELDETMPGEVHHPPERKQKKRDQNKTAAHRYRQRKRAELDCLEEQLHGLEGHNRELRDKAESVEREIQYVKDLLIEVYKARSQRLKQPDTNA
ncbi:uncharacterized protein atf5a [Oncorhynchus kisutch]|uniref:Activating transcription factor 5a n=1 Tax=Oncorhynchus kisutch TaxID=8019 RepID=A0A8C7KTM3_ONCKI|nr:uncharacterized protein LOC109872754 [Oncorhynchus kisutch]